MGGPFEVLSVEDLRSRLEQVVVEMDQHLGTISFKNIVGDVRALHADPKNAGSVFQVASQFNCLEMVEPGVRPEDGITRYHSDPTQGPACALSCPAATVYRNYLVNERGQGGGHQIECLSGVGELLNNGKHQHWKLSNGYCLPDKGLKKVNDLLLDPDLSAACRSRLQVGVHWDTDVKSKNHRVCQIFASALPVSYAKSTRSEEWAPFAQVVLDGAYEGTLAAAAVLAAQRQTRLKVYLTAVGGGAFGNRTSWILAALDRALRIHGSAPLDVLLVHYGTLPRGAFKELERRPRISISGEQPAHLNRDLTSKFKTLFRDLDSNGDGVLDHQDLEKTLPLLDPDLFEPDDVEDILAGAGNENGELRFSEFVAWVHAAKCPTTARLLAEVSH